MKQLPLALRLRERAVFDSFIPGANLALLGQLRALAARPTKGVYWLAGPPGCGKSHLLQAACAQAAAIGAQCAYLPLAQLAEFGTESLDGWQEASLLALDDAGHLAARAEWNRALFRLYREADERGATLLLAARDAPRALPFALADLASRFSAATLLSLQSLDEADQRRVLKARAAARGLTLPSETARYLQRRFPRDLTTLCELLDAIDEASLEAQRRLTVPFIRQVLATHPRANSA